MNEQEIRAIVREMQRIVGITPPEDAGVFGKISAAFEAILERDADTQRRLAALERASGGAPGARGEETAAPTSPGLWRCENCGDAYDVADSRWRMADVPEHACGSIPQCGHFRSRWFGSGPPELPTYDGPRSRPYIRVEPTSPAAWTERWSSDQYAAAQRILECARAIKWGDMLDDFCGTIQRAAPLFAPPKPAPSVEDCERAYFDAFASTIKSNGGNDPNRSRSAGIAAVRALCIENKGDGADGGDRKSAPAINPAGSAPSPTFTPDREALQKHLYWEARRPESWIASWESVANVAMTYFAPLIAERDALRKERDEWWGVTCKRIDAVMENDRKRDEELVKERDALRARIAELEARKPTVTRDSIAEALTCHSQATLTNIMVVVLKRAGIEVTP